MFFCTPPTPPVGVQQHGALVSAGAESHQHSVPSGAQGRQGGQGDQEREPWQLQHERQELANGLSGDVSISLRLGEWGGCYRGTLSSWRGGVRCVFLLGGTESAQKVLSKGVSSLSKPPGCA